MLAPGRFEGEPLLADRVQQPHIRDAVLASSRAKVSNLKRKNSARGARGKSLRRLGVPKRRAGCRYAYRLSR